MVIGIEEHFYHDGVVESFFLLTEKISFQDAIDLIAVLLEAYIRRYHCNRIVFHTVDDQLVHAYQANAVRCDNHQFIYLRLRAYIAVDCRYLVGCLGDVRAHWYHMDRQNIRRQQQHKPHAAQHSVAAARG